MFSGPEFSRILILVFLIVTLWGFWIVYSMREVVMRPSLPAPSWQSIVQEKLERDRAKIPQEWLLSPEVVKMGKNRDKIVGEFIESLLDEASVQITGIDAPNLVEYMGNGSLTALQVVSAFCKRAAYAHQLVSYMIFLCRLLSGSDNLFLLLTYRSRRCSSKSTSSLHYSEPKSWTNISKKMVNYLGLYMGYLSL